MNLEVASTARSSAASRRICDRWAGRCRQRRRPWQLHHRQSRRARTARYLDRVRAHGGTRATACAWLSVLLYPVEGRPSEHRPHLRQHLRLFEYRLRSLLLFVRRIAVLAQDAFDQHTQLRADVVAERLVNSDILAHRLDQLPRDGAERVVAEHFHRTVVGLERVVERELVLG